MATRGRPRKNADAEDVADLATKHQDGETAAMIYEGLSITQLSRLLGMNVPDIKLKLGEFQIRPAGNRSGYPYYKIKEVLPYLVKPAYDIEKYIRTMHQADLPKMLTKEYWAGQRSRQEFEFRAGHLWSTEKVIKEVGELMKLIKMSALLTVDTVDRQSELSEKQRKIIKDIMDGMLIDLYKAVQAKFKEVKKDGEPDTSASGGQALPSDPEEDL